LPYRQWRCADVSGRRVGRQHRIRRGRGVSGRCFATPAWARVARWRGAVPRPGR
jgi:hypothetical protein